MLVLVPQYNEDLSLEKLSCVFLLLCKILQIMSQVEGQQKNLVQAIESLPGSGPLSALDQDLLLLKATSAATLSCLGECLHLLQQSINQVNSYDKRTLSSGEQSCFSGHLLGAVDNGLLNLGFLNQ